MTAPGVRSGGRGVRSGGWGGQSVGRGGRAGGRGGRAGGRGVAAVGRGVLLVLALPAVLFAVWWVVSAVSGNFYFPPLRDTTISAN